MSNFIGTEEHIKDGGVAHHHNERFLQGPVQSDSRGRAILTILYLIVLGLCFIVPVFYYFRMHMEDRRLRRLRELQLQSVIASLDESTAPEAGDEMRAVRRKYREEKRARILQLFAPVQMVVTSMNLKEKDSEQQQTSWDPLINPATSENSTSASTDDLEQGGNTVTSNESTWQDGMQLIDNEEDNMRVEIPVDGSLLTSESLSLQSSLYKNSPLRRLVPNLCVICLSNYEVGETIVWSSNPSCEHAFHNNCIEQWLLKQRGRPLCPCCRRDFVFDPLDEEPTADAGIQSLFFVEEQRQERQQQDTDDHLMDVS